MYVGDGIIALKILVSRGFYIKTYLPNTEVEVMCNTVPRQSISGVASGLKKSGLLKISVFISVFTEEFQKNGGLLFLKVDSCISKFLL